MTTPVRTTVPRTQKQQNYNSGRNILRATRNRLTQTAPQHNRNAQPFPNQSLPPENMYYSPPQQANQRVHQLPTVNRPGGSSGYGNDDRNQFTSHNAYPSFSSQQPVTQRGYQPRVYQPPSPLRSLSSTSDSDASAPAYNHYNISGICAATGATKKQKEQDMAKKRREMQQQMKRDAEDYMKKQKEKEQKKREEYIMRHRFMYPDLFGGHKLGDSNNENFNENLEPEIDSVPVDPFAVRIKQEEARRKMQEEYDAKARKHAEKMNKAEEAKRAQQAELASKMKAEADKYKVGRQNSEADVNVHTKPDPVTLRTEEEETRRKMQDDYDAKARKCAEKMNQMEEAKRAQQAESAAKINSERRYTHKADLQDKTPDVNTHTEPVVKLNENKATRKTQDQLDKIGLQNSGCISVDTDFPIKQMKKSGKQEINKNDLEYEEKMDACHYKYGILPAVPTLKLRMNPVNNTVKKHLNEELVTNKADMVNKVEEKRLSEHVSSINDTKPVDKEKEFREEMRRARLKMQEAMNLKVQEFQAKSKEEDLP